MTATRQAKTLGVTTSTVTRLETSEADETISLATLRRAAEALGCELQYALVPKQSLADTLEARATALACQQMAAIRHSMALEAQATAPRIHDARRTLPDPPGDLHGRYNLHPPPSSPRGHPRLSQWQRTPGPDDDRPARRTPGPAALQLGEPQPGRWQPHRRHPDPTQLHHRPASYRRPRHGAAAGLCAKLSGRNPEMIGEDLISPGHGTVVRPQPPLPSVSPSGCSMLRSGRLVTRNFGVIDHNQFIGSTECRPDKASIDQQQPHAGDAHDTAVAVR